MLILNSTIDNKLRSIFNQKKLKNTCLNFKCLQRISIPAFAGYAGEINSNYTTRNNNRNLRLPFVSTVAARKSFCLMEIDVKTNSTWGIVLRTLFSYSNQI